MADWGKLADDQSMAKAVVALEANGMEVVMVDSGEGARKTVLGLLPEGAEVMDVSSVTLQTIGLTEEIEKSGKYISVKSKLAKMNRETQGRQMQELGAAPQYAVGSVHAVTEGGQVLVASNTGSQLGPYAYGADRVIWVVGAQKIVKNLEEGMRRIYEYSLVLESERVKKAYGMPRSNVSKILIVNKEIKPGRITVVIVKEVLGY